MKRVIPIIVFYLVFGQFAALSHAQTTPTPSTFNPYSAELDEDVAAPLETDATSSASNDILYNLSILDGETDKLQSTFGLINEQGDFVPGSLGRLKIKPSDKKRLIKIISGNLTAKEKELFAYDKRLMDLLVLLVTPKEQGGAGLTHLRVGDFLRYRNDPKSKETEGTDNISQHQFGKAADILEVNTARCTKKGLFSSKKMAAFPVKVQWQGGLPPNPSLSVLGSFDAVARANAFRDILGVLPGDSYNGSVQGFTDLLQQMQRRVIAREMGLDSASLDYLSHNDMLETLGRVAVNYSLDYAPGALAGNSADEMLRSIPRAQLEKSLLLPPTALQGDDWNQSLERLGRMTVAYQANVDPQSVIKGDVSALGQSPYFRQYSNRDDAYRFPAGSFDGMQANRPEAFRQVGALLIADRLSYSETEANDLVEQARDNRVSQLSLARYGDIVDFPGNLLPLIAPAEGSTKAKGEQYLGDTFLRNKSATTFASLPEQIQDVLKANSTLLVKLNDRQSITRFIITTSPDKLETIYRQIGARYMETVFDLPSDSFAEAVRRYQTPTLEQFLSVLAKQLKNDPLTRDEPTSANNYFDTTFRDNVANLYHGAEAGPARFSTEDLFALLSGKQDTAAIRAAASWVEEDLGLTPNSFGLFFTPESAEEKMVNAGAAVIAAELYDAFDLSLGNLKTGNDLKLAIGQAKVETVLGLKPGSFKASFESMKQTNSDRFARIFEAKTDLDTVLSLEGGTIDRLKKSQITPDEIARTVGNRSIDGLKTEDLQDKFGWDGAYKIDGEKLLRTIQSGDGTTKDVKSGEGVTMRSLLAKVGSYNSDFAFGYEPDTMSKWLTASPKDQDAVFLQQGAKMYSDRLGLDPKNRSDLLDSYVQNKDEAKKRVVETLKKQLEQSDDEAKDQILEAAKNELGDQIDALEDKLNHTTTDNPIERAALKAAQSNLTKAKAKLNPVNKDDVLSRAKPDKKVDALPNPISTRDLLNSIKDDITGAVKEIDKTESNNAQLFGQTKDELVDINERIGTEITKWEKKNNLPTAKITIPQKDLESFIKGNTKLAQGVLVAARQAKQTLTEVKDTYELARLMVTGWGSDPETERQLFVEIRDRYSAQLEEYAALQGIKQIGSALDRADILPYTDFERLTKGVLKPDGQFAQNDTPYPGEAVDRIKQGFLANKEAKNTFYYGTMDYQMRKTNPDLPKNFSKTIMEGSNKDRAKMLYSFLSGKADKSLVDSLPTDIQPVARQYLALYNTDEKKFKNPDYDPEKEITKENQKFLEKKSVIDDWSNAIISTTLRKQDKQLPSNVGEILRTGTEDERKQLAFSYAAAKFGDDAARNLPTELRPLAKLYLDQYDVATGKFRNPNYNKNKPDSGDNPQYLERADHVIALTNVAEQIINNQFKQLDSSLPNDSGSTLIFGTDLDRKKLAFSFASTKLTLPLLSTLPDNLQGLAQSYMKNFDVESGKVLKQDEIFTNWAATMTSSFIGVKIPKEALEIANVYIAEGKEGLKLFMLSNAADKIDQFRTKLDAKIEAFVSMGKEKMVLWIGRQLGLPTDTMKAYYDKYKLVKGLYKNWQTGKISAAEAILAADQILLDGKLTKLVGKLDDALGLPAGSAQSLIMFAVTGNPLYAFQFAYTLFFGYTIKCPNLQQTAQKNVKLLIESVLDLGKYERELVPSQIITYEQSSVVPLLNKVKDNYAHCLAEPNSRCGVFARPEYARHVHIGF